MVSFLMVKVLMAQFVIGLKFKGCQNYSYYLHLQRKTLFLVS